MKSGGFSGELDKHTVQPAAQVGSSGNTHEPWANTFNVSCTATSQFSAL